MAKVKYSKYPEKVSTPERTYFPRVRFLVPQPDEVSAASDVQRVETKKPGLGMVLAPRGVGGF